MEKTVLVIHRRPPRDPARRVAAPTEAPKTGAASDRPPLWSAVIRGEPTPRARLHDVVVADGTARLVRSRPARLWQNRAMGQLLNRRPARPLSVDLVLECRFWSAARRPAIDEALLIDLLERAAIIADGAQIREKHVFAARDAEDPRVAVTLARLPVAP